MKYMMKRALPLVLAVLLLLSTLTLLCGAQGQERVDFVKSEDGRSISCGDTVYDWYDFSGAMYSMPDAYYCYEDTVTINGELCEIECASSYRDVIFLCPESGGFYIYATEQGRVYLDEFFNERKHVREYAVFTDSKQYAAVSEGFLSRVEELKNDPETERRAFSGATLERSEKADLGARDSYRAYMARYGMIYTLSDGYYYLDRAVFGEDFNLPDIYTSSAPTELFKLSDALADEYNEALRRATRYSADYIHEGEEHEIEIGEDEETNMSVLLVLFWIIFACFAFVLPVGGLCFAFCKARANGTESTRHWYAPMLLCGVWIAIGIALMLILLL